jgi:predicted nucleic acid-binding protein
VSVYLDASALVALYLPEVFSAEADQWAQSATDRIVSDLTLCEARVAIDRRRKAGDLTPDGCARALARLDQHVAVGVYRVVPWSAAWFVDGVALAASVSVPVRAMDAVHVAISRSLGVGMISFDRNQRRAARAMQVALMPPHLPTDAHPA